MINFPYLSGGAHYLASISLPNWDGICVPSDTPRSPRTSVNNLSNRVYYRRTILTPQQCIRDSSISKNYLYSLRLSFSVSVGMSIPFYLSNKMGSSQCIKTTSRFVTDTSVFPAEKRETLDWTFRLTSSP